MAINDFTTLEQRLNTLHVSTVCDTEFKRASVYNLARSQINQFVPNGNDQAYLLRALRVGAKPSGVSYISTGIENVLVAIEKMGVPA